jgi:hypothetical protein
VAGWKPQDAKEKRHKIASRIVETHGKDRRPLAMEPPSGIVNVGNWLDSAKRYLPRGGVSRPIARRLTAKVRD